MEKTKMFSVMPKTGFETTLPGRKIEVAWDRLNAVDDILGELSVAAEDQVDIAKDMETIVRDLRLKFNDLTR